MLEVFGLFVGIVVAFWVALCVLAVVGVTLALITYPVGWALAKVIGYVPRD